MDRTAKLDFRLAQLKDRDALLRLMRALETVDPTGTPFDEERRRNALGKFLSDDACGRAWLICDAETIAGYVVLAFTFSFEFGGSDAFIDKLCVEPEYRRQGLGSAGAQICRGRLPVTRRECGAGSHA